MEVLELLLATLIVLICCLIVYGVLNKKSRKKSEANLDDPDQIYAQSAGGYDEAAALALHQSEDRSSPVDHLRAATIIFRNIISQEHRAQADPTTGRPTRRDEEISRRRREMFGRAREHHMAALAGLADTVIAQDEAERANRRYRPTREAPPPRGEVPGRPGVETFIDAAVEFAFGGAEILFTNDPLLAVLLGGPAVEILFPDQEMANLAEDRRHQTVQSRLETAATIAESQGGGRGAQVDAFLDLSQRNTSDAQNSHDSSVNAAKRAILARLRADQVGVQLPSLDHIIDELQRGAAVFSRDPRTAQARPPLTEKAIAVVNRARNGERSTSTQASDEEVLRRVWARADESRNSDRKSLLRQAIYDALVDSWEQGLGGEKIQCVDGRISRVLGALTLLDWDKQNWEMRRLEQYKNDIFTLAAETIRVAAVEAAQSDDTALQTIGRAYLANSTAELARAGPIDPAKEKEWMTETRARVSQAIDDYLASLDAGVPDAVPKYMIEGIKTEALAALAD